MQLPCRLNFPASSNRNKVAAAGRHGRSLHPPDRAQPRPGVRLLGQARGLHGPAPHRRRHCHCGVCSGCCSSRPPGETKLTRHIKMKLILNMCIVSGMVCITRGLKLISQYLM